MILQRVDVVETSPTPYFAQGCLALRFRNTERVAVVALDREQAAGLAAALMVWLEGSEI